MRHIVTLVLVVFAVIGFYGLTQNPSNLFCSLLLMALPAWLALAAWNDTASLQGDLDDDCEAI